MTEQDRGAYAPQNDAPLAFDPRRASGRGGPAPLTLIVSFIVLAAVVAGIVLLYRHGARRHGEPPQIVGAPIGDTKTAPLSSEAPSDASAQLQVYKTEAPSSGSAAPPTFAAPPEEPQARPVTRPPAPPSVTVAPLRAAEPAPVVPPPVAKVAPAKVAPVPPKIAKPVVVAAAAAPKPVVAPPPPAAPAGGVVAQVGSETSAALADKAWTDVSRKVPGQMAGKSRKVETFNKNGTVFYRVLVGGFASRADAAKFCAALKAAGGDCIVR